jgi:hypothetical protein
MSAQAMLCGYQLLITTRAFTPINVGVLTHYFDFGS